MSSNGHPASADNPVEQTKHPLIALAQKVRPEVKSSKTDAEKAEARAALARQIEGGYIDLGPQIEHEPQTEDIRDLRDPVSIGSTILRTNRADSGGSLSFKYDKLDDLGLLPNITYRGDFIDHTAERDAELRERAEKGDKFAAAILRGDTLAEEPTD